MGIYLFSLFILFYTNIDHCYVKRRIQVDRKFVRNICLIFISAFVGTHQGHLYNHLKLIFPNDSILFKYTIFFFE